MEETSRKCEKALGHLKGSVILTHLVSKAMFPKCSKLTNDRGKQSAEDTGSRKGKKEVLSPLGKL